MRAYMVLFAALGAPLQVLSDLGLIVGGIWLCVLGKWGIVGYGAAAILLGFFPLYIATRPIVPLTKPSYAFLERGNKAGFYVLGFFASLYTVAIFAVWSVGVLYFFTRQADATSFVAILLWSYGVATKPIVAAARHFMSGVGSWNAVQCAQYGEAAYVICGLAVLIFNASLGDVVALFGVIMLGGSILVLRVQLELHGLSGLG